MYQHVPEEDTYDEDNERDNSRIDRDDLKITEHSYIIIVGIWFVADICQLPRRDIIRQK